MGLRIGFRHIAGGHEDDAGLISSMHVRFHSAQFMKLREMDSSEEFSTKDPIPDKLLVVRIKINIGFFSFKANIYRIYAWNGGQ